MREHGVDDGHLRRGSGETDARIRFATCLDTDQEHVIDGTRLHAARQIELVEQIPLIAVHAVLRACHEKFALDVAHGAGQRVAELIAVRGVAEHIPQRPAAAQRLLPGDGLGTHAVLQEIVGGIAVIERPRFVERLALPRRDAAIGQTIVVEELTLDEKLRSLVRTIRK